MQHANPHTPNAQRAAEPGNRPLELIYGFVTIRAHTSRSGARVAPALRSAIGDLILCAARGGAGEIF